MSGVLEGVYLIGVYFEDVVGNWFVFVVFVVCEVIYCGVFNGVNGGDGMVVKWIGCYCVMMIFYGWWLLL